MFRAMKRHFRDALNGIKTHRAMSFNASGVITLTLVLMSIMLIILLNISQLTVSLQEDVKIFVRVNEDIAESGINNLQNQIRRINGVGQVEYSSKDNELDKLKEEFGESGEMFEIYRENNPLSRAFIVEVLEGYSISDINNAVKRIEGIKDSDFGGASTEKYIAVLRAIRTGGSIIILVLATIAVFLVYSTIKMAIISRENETSIMKVVGAKNGYIRAPFVLEGMFMGLIGSIIPVLITIFGYDYGYKVLGGKLITGVLPLQPVFPFVGYISLALIAMGIVVGFIGSYLSVNRNLRWTR